MFSFLFRQVMVIEKCRWYGGWDLKYADLLDRIKGTPILDGDKIVYHIKVGLMSRV